MAKKKKKTKLGNEGEGGFVYSTNQNFALSGLADLLGDNQAPEEPDVLEVHLEKKHRGGKAAIIVRGFVGNDDEMQALAKKLKTSMGVGGSAKEGEIIIQGDNRKRVMDLLDEWGYKTKRIGG